MFKTKWGIMIKVLKKRRILVYSLVIPLILCIGTIIFFLTAKNFDAYQYYLSKFPKQAEMKGQSLTTGTAEVLLESSQTLGVDKIQGFENAEKNPSVPNFSLPLKYKEPMKYNQGMFTIYLVPLDAKESKGKIFDNKLVYPGTYRSVDTIYYIYNGGVKEDLVFKNEKSPTQIRWKMVLENLTAQKKDDGTIEFKKNTDNQLEFVFPKLYIVDKDGNKIDNKVSYDIQDDILLLNIDRAGLSFSFLVSQIIMP